MQVRKIGILLIPLITVLFLVALWFSYYDNRINSFVYVGLLLVTLFIALILLIVFRNHKEFIGKIKVMAFMVILDIMGRNVKKYLSKDIGIINEFVERGDISGDSAGLV